jgi:hypothetical protein
VDTRAFVKARLFDVVIGNWDRHQQQWRWARMPGSPLWEPVPEDADQALTKYQGKALGYSRNLIPLFMNYSGEYPKRIEGLTQNNVDVTRWFPADVDWPTFEALAKEVARFGIKVTCVYPGRFRTDFLDGSSLHYGQITVDDYAKTSSWLSVSLILR